MTEEFALEELFGDRRARDGHEGLVGAATLVVDRLRDEVLASAALTRDEDGRSLARGNATDHLADLAHDGSLADDRRGPGALAGLVARGLDFSVDLRVFQGLPDMDEQLLGFAWLLHVVLRPELDRLDGILDRGEGRHHDDGLIGSLLVDLAEKLEPVRIGKVQVEQNEIPRVLDGLAGVGRGAHSVDGESIVSEPPNQGVVQDELVFHDQNTLRHEAPPGSSPAREIRG